MWFRKAHESGAGSGFARGGGGCKGRGESFIHNDEGKTQLSRIIVRPVGQEGKFQRAKTRTGERTCTDSARREKVHYAQKPRRITHLQGRRHVIFQPCSMGEPQDEAFSSTRALLCPATEEERAVGAAEAE